MIDSSPRPLPQSRLGKIVWGLRERMSGSLQKTADEVENLADDIALREGRLNESLEKVEHVHLQQVDVTTTEWDEAIQQCWDQAELRTYQAIFETAEKESKLRLNAKARIKETNDEAKKRITEIERRFLQAKEVPLKRLKNFRAGNQQLLEQLAAVEQATSQALTQRSMRAPSIEIPTPSIDRPKNSNRAVEAIKESIGTAQTHSRMITHNRLANLMGSAWWFCLCGLIFVGTTVGLVMANVFPLLQALLIGAGASVGLGLFGLAGSIPLVRRIVKREYPRMQTAIEEGKVLHRHAEDLAVAENDAELKRLAEKRDERFEQAKQWAESTVKEILAKAEADIQELHTKAKESKQFAKKMLTRSTKETNGNFEQRLGSEENAIRNQQSELKEKFDIERSKIQERIEELTRKGALRMHIATQKALKIVSRSRRWCQDHFPAWDAFEVPDAWPETLREPVVPLGTLRMNSVLPNSAKLDVSESQLEAPFLFSPLHDEYLAITGDPNSPVVQGLIKNMVMRALTALPAGKAQACIVDPPGLGQEFGWLMHLSDFDAQLVTHRVWTQPGHIAKQMATLTMAAEDFIQQSLRNQYSDIVAYNLEAGALSEPFRILVWSSFPSGLDETSWKALRSVLDTGARCGIFSILVVDPDAAWPNQESQDYVYRRGLHLRLDGQGFRMLRPSESGPQEQHDSSDTDHSSSLYVEPLPVAPDALSQSIMQRVGKRALTANRVEVPLERMLPDKDGRWSADSSHFLEIPVGQSGVGRTHSLKLGVGTAQHAIIAGKTGSGKSSLLHALITSATMKYSPQQLRLVLLDFKKGVEFQTYSDSHIAHADIIGIESHREFGLSTLEYVDSCMQRRGEAFRSAGVQDIASWNAVRPDEALPRMLMVVDEFQELFVEDDKLSGQASLILDRIVRQGRSFGIHAVLSSQTLAGSYSLPRTTLGQMAVRIALQCDPSDAQIIFAEDNPAAARLKHPGQAVYNDAGGRIEGNQPMQIGWLPKTTQQQWLAELPQGYQNQDATTNLLGRTVVYDGNRAATWDDGNANLALEQAKRDVNPDATWCILGESVAIHPAIVAPLTQQAGRNMLMVGNNDAQAAATLHTIAASFVREKQAAGQTPELRVVQAAKPTEARALALNQSLPKLAAPITIVDQRQSADLMSNLHTELQERNENEDQEHPPILALLVQLGRMRELRKEDDFASFGETELTADKKLEEVLRDGPSVGIHLVLWAENYTTVNRWLSRSALREMEIRLLMQMSANDSTNLVDSVAASRLGEHVMLMFDEATGNEDRFRPYAIDSLEALTSWVDGTA